MKILTEYQKRFLLDYFFKNEKYAGWENIAKTLLEDGECIVAGKGCIWVGGIGNFIKVTESINMIDCVLYKFDLDYFLTSNWYKEIKDNYISVLYEKKIQIEQNYNEISKI